MMRLFFTVYLLLSINTCIFSQVGIGTNTPNQESILDIESTTKGLLIPRVNLTSSTLDLDGDTTQPVGLMVFNVGSTLPVGFYFWNGTEWRNIKDFSSTPPSINSINCLSAALSPKSYVAGSSYVGSMSVAYTGGNGASYNSGVPIPSTGVTGLTATLRSGSLNVGDGVLIYDIAGTPSGSSPLTATFAIPTTFGATGCNVVVGAGNVFAIGEVQSFRVRVNASTFFANSGSRQRATNSSESVSLFTDRVAYELATPSEQAIYPVINGLRMDFMETPFVSEGISPVLYNTTNAIITYSISSLSTNDQFITGANTVLPGLTYSYKIDGNDHFSVTQGAGGDTEYVNAMLTFPTGEWYQLTYHATRDNTYLYFYMTAQRLN